MRTKKNIFWGIFLAVIAVGIILLMVIPGFELGKVPVWKWFIAVLPVFWLIRKVVFGKRLRDRLSFFLPLAVLFLLFEAELGPCFGLASDFINNWLVILAAFLLTGAVHFLCGSKLHVKVNTDNKLGSTVTYLDASDPTAKTVFNRLGETEIFFVNTDQGDTTLPVRVEISNELGETIVHVPEDWAVRNRIVSSLGEVSLKKAPFAGSRVLELTGDNHLGEISIRYESDGPYEEEDDD